MGTTGASFLAIASVITVFLSPHTALADTILLAPAATVDKRCAGEFREMGLYCQKDGDVRPTLDQRVGGIPLLSGRGSFDSPDMRVAAILHLNPQKTPSGFEYYSATTERFKTGIFQREFAPTERFEKAIWTFIEDSGLPLGSSEDEKTASFIAENDAALQRRQASRAAEEERRAKAQAALDYENSPAGKKEAAGRVVDSCRRTISNARRAIAQDERAAEISGYENKAMRYEAGVAIVNCEDAIARGGYPADQ